MCVYAPPLDLAVLATQRDDCFHFDIKYIIVNDPE
jgi:hypothetical protein